VSDLSIFFFMLHLLKLVSSGFNGFFNFDKLLVLLCYLVKVYQLCFVRGGLRLSVQKSEALPAMRTANKGVGLTRLNSLEI